MPKEDPPPDRTPKPTDKPGESLAEGGDKRPWYVGVSAERQRTALQLFRDGNVLLNDGLFAKALEKYREALKSWDHPAIHYNMALALMSLDQPIEVYDALQKAMKYDDAPLGKDKFDHARDYSLLIAKQIASIEVSCDKKGARVSVDGKYVFTGPGKHAERVRVGKHQFVAEKEGYQARIKAPYIGAGENFRIELKLYTAEDLTRYRRNFTNKAWVPWAIVGGGVAMAAVGGVLQLGARNNFRDFDKRVEACSMSASGCSITDDLIALRDSGETKRTLSYAAFGVAGGVAAIGLTFAYLNRKRPYEIRPEELGDTDDNQPMKVAPVVTPNMVGAMAQGRF